MVGTSYRVQWGKRDEVAVAKILASGTDTEMRRLKVSKERETSKRKGSPTPDSQTCSPKRRRSSTPQSRPASSPKRRRNSSPHSRPASSQKRRRNSTPQSRQQATKVNVEIGCWSKRLLTMFQ